MMTDMDVIIKNFEIPKNCCCCPLNTPNKDHNICYPVGTELSDSMSIDDDERPDFCPVEELVRCRDCIAFHPFEENEGYGDCGNTTSNIAVRADDYCRNAVKAQRDPNIIKVSEDWALYASGRSESGLHDE